MRKALAMIFALSVSFSIWADNRPENPTRTNAEVRLPEYRDPGNRTQTFELYMEDSFGDGWNGASIDLYVVNPADVLGLDPGDDDWQALATAGTITAVAGLTVAASDGDGYTNYSSYFFDMEVGQQAVAVWNSGSYDNECGYGFFDTEGFNVANEAVYPEGTNFTLITQTSDLVIAGVLDLNGSLGGSNGKGLVFYAHNAIADLSVYGVGVANNGGGTDGQEYTFPAQSMAAGEVLWGVRNAESYASYFGDELANITVLVDEGGSVSQNGDEAIELYHDVRNFHLALTKWYLVQMKIQFLENYVPFQGENSSQIYLHIDSYHNKLSYLSPNSIFPFLQSQRLQKNN